VFAKGDIGDLQAKLERLLRDGGLRAGLGKRARQWVEKERSWDVSGRVCVMAYPDTAKKEYK
ncbi:MAG TPA: hypothetical protein PKJ84_06445, partial [Anaerolineales bacterium]|nr:hypothetical protein [Anaerolineales bacterium]